MAGAQQVCGDQMAEHEPCRHAQKGKAKPVGDPDVVYRDNGNGSVSSEEPVLVLGFQGAALILLLRYRSAAEASTGPTAARAQEASPTRALATDR